MADARFAEEFWTDPKVQSLDLNTQRLFIYLFTNPHRNYCGLYYLPKGYIKEQTKLPDTSIDRGMDTLIHGQFIEYDEEFKIVFVKNMLKRQIGKVEMLNQKQLKGIANHLETLHNCPLIQRFLDKYHYLDIPYKYTPVDTPINTPMHIQSQSKSKSKSRDIPPSPLPDNFQISERVLNWAKKNNHNHLADHLEAFKLRAQAKGYRYKDWDAAFMVAIRENWGKVDLTIPEKPPPRQICKSCGAWQDKCVCTKELTNAKIN